MCTVEELQDKVRTEIQERSERLNRKKPAELYLPVEYTLEMGGKRLRPVLLLMGFNLFSDDIKTAMPAALAIEVFHNFTLLHDDIMDKAEMRRNRPTVHKKFSENSAILSGDVMSFLSYEYLFEVNSERIQDVARLFTQTAIEVCEGQQFDMDFENRLDVTEAEYLEMIKLKTAVLLGCSLKAGALLAGAPDKTASQLYDYGLNLGLAFQLQDDLLDTFGDQETFGKKIGGDILANKKTYLLIKALEMASEKQLSELKKWMEPGNFNEDEKINSVKNSYNQIGIKQLAEDKIESYFNTSAKIFEEVDVPAARKQPLETLGKTMLKRDH
jgi:geranylgeranyl diphosphate synthase type II